MAVKLSASKSQQKPKIVLAADGANAFKFMFQTEHTKLVGRVSVFLEGGKPDQRGATEKMKLAQERIKSVAVAFAKACEVELNEKGSVLKASAIQRKRMSAPL